MSSKELPSGRRMSPEILSYALEGAATAQVSVESVRSVTATMQEVGLQIWPGVAVAKNCFCCGTFCTAVVLPLCAAKFLRLCLLVALTLSAIL